MCVLSMVMDDWAKRNPVIHPATDTVFWPATVSRQEFDELRDEVKSLKKLLKAARIYDDETGQPGCEVKKKVKMIKKLAKMLDVDMEDVFE